MDQAKFDAYLTERFQDQVSWYGKSSKTNKQRYTQFQWGVIILASAIPVLVVSLPENWTWLSAGLGVLLAVGTAALKTFKFQENWLNYRQTSEAMKSEKWQFDAGIGAYTGSNRPEALFVERIEGLMTGEHDSWATIQQRDDDAQDAEG